MKVRYGCLALVFLSCLSALAEEVPSIHSRIIRPGSTDHVGWYGGYKGQLPDPWRSGTDDPYDTVQSGPGRFIEKSYCPRRGPCNFLSSGALPAIHSEIDQATQRELGSYRGELVQALKASAADMIREQKAALARVEAAVAADVTDFSQRIAAGAYTLAPVNFAPDANSDIQSWLEQAPSGADLAVLPQDLVPAVANYPFKAPADSKGGKALVREQAYLDHARQELKRSPANYQQRAQFSQLAQDTLASADDAFVAGEEEVGFDLLTMAHHATDFVLGIAPPTSFPKSLYELCMGKNLVTGEALDELDRSFALFDVATLGFGGKIPRVIQAVKRVTGRIGTFAAAFFRRTDRISKIAAEVGIDLKHAERYGKAAIAALEDSGVQTAAKRWGTLPDGRNQLFEHSAGKDIGRLKGLEERAKLPVGSLQDAKSGDATQVAKALQELDKLALRVKVDGASKISQIGSKKAFWIEDVADPKAGIAAIEFEDKFQSVMPMLRKKWERFEP